MEGKPRSLKEIAEVKDKILELLCTKGSSQTIADMHYALKLNSLVIVNLVEEERKYFIFINQKGTYADHQMTPAQVQVTLDGEYLYHHGGGFIGLYNKEEINKRKEKWKKIFSVIYACMLVVFTALAAYGAINTKLYDKKEYRLESNIDAMQVKIDKLQQKLEAIPDSIRQKYLVQ